MLLKTKQSLIFIMKKQKRGNGVMTAEEKLVVARIRKEIVVTSENGAPLSLFDRVLLMAKIQRK